MAVLFPIFHVYFPTHQECFTDKGFKRGQQIFFDQLAIQYPEVNSCEAFADKESLNEKDGDQRCSVAEEVVNGQDVARCINSMQVRRHTDNWTTITLISRETRNAIERL